MNRAADCGTRPGARDATLPLSVGVTIAVSDYALTTEVIIAAALAGLRQPTDLELTDRALWELEEANLRAYAHLHGHDGSFSKPTMEACKLPPPPDWIRQLIIRLQDTYDPRRSKRSLRDTVTAHEEIMRLQGYLMSSAPEDQEICLDCGAPLSPREWQFTRCFPCREVRREQEREYKAKARLRARLKQATV